MTSKFNVVARYKTKAGSTDQILEHLRVMAEETRAEPGNISYDYFRGVADDTQIVILESYHTAGDFDLHRRTQHFLTIGAVHIIPELEARTVATYLTTEGPTEAP